MRRKPPASITAFFVLVALLLTACGGSPRAASTTAPTAMAQAPSVRATAVPTTAQPVATLRSAPTALPAVVPSVMPTGVPTHVPKPTRPADPAATTPPSPTTAPTSVHAQAPSPTATTAAQYGVPVRLIINTPQVHVDAAVENVGLTPDGAMDVPKKWEDVAWYDLGPHPGEIGNSVIAGHLDSTTGPAVFWRLKDLHIGDKVSVVDESGRTITFKVTKTDSYTNDNAPLQEIFGPWNSARLNLITCDGTWDPDKKQYDKKLVVYTERVS